MCPLRCSVPDLVCMQGLLQSDETISDRATMYEMKVSSAPIPVAGPSREEMKARASELIAEVIGEIRKPIEDLVDEVVGVRLEGYNKRIEEVKVVADAARAGVADCVQELRKLGKEKVNQADFATQMAGLKGTISCVSRW